MEMMTLRARTTQVRGTGATICRFTYNQPPFYKYLTSSRALPYLLFTFHRARASFLFLFIHFLFFFIYLFLPSFRDEKCREIILERIKRCLLSSQEFVCSHTLINSRVEVEELMNVLSVEKNV